MLFCIGRNISDAREELIDLEIKRAKLQIELLQKTQNNLEKEEKKLDLEIINQNFWQAQLIADLSEKGLVMSGE